MALHALGVLLLAGPGLTVAAAPAQAQETGDSVQRAADDAFGTSVGRDSIGLYSTGSVRGFSPASAGNFRIEGLYTDTVTDLTDLAGTLIQGSAVKVGPSVHGYPFPAPTGIADFQLNLPGDAHAAAVEVGADEVGGAYLELGADLPMTGRAALGAGLAISRDAVTYARPARHLALSMTLRWRPLDSVEILPFAGYYWHDDDPAQPRYIVAGEGLPPEISRNRSLTQPWARNDAAEGIVGLIGRWRSSSGTALDGGVFAQERRSEVSYSDQFSGIAGPATLALHRMVATPPQLSRSVSGEVRISHEVEEGRRRHRFIAAVRGRAQRRSYGGSAIVTLGSTRIDDPGIVPKPDFAFNRQSTDRVRQLAAGLGYHVRWGSTGEISVDAQRMLYRKVRTDSAGVDLRIAEALWTYSGSVALYLTRELALFGGLNRGFEETAPAPESAVNRYEAPPAAFTSQRDVGLRWNIRQDLRLIAGLFSIEKPYFNLDSDSVYRRLGTVRHRGIELSLTGEPVANLNLLAGLVAMDARVTSETGEGGVGALRPVATPQRIALLSGDYRLARVPGLSLEFTISHRGSRAANSGNTFFVPPSTTITAGVRYRWEARNIPMSVRVQVSNLLDSYSWDIRASNSFFYSNPRMVSVRLTSEL